eukprot:scaffold5804_cov117-Skeletonema_dohrnii-CCMP3373.AAC.7
MVLRLEQVVGRVKSSEHYVKISQPFHRKVTTHLVYGTTQYHLGLSPDGWIQGGDNIKLKNTEKQNT